MTLIPTILVALLSLNCYSYAADNGLALTPPMGWLTWERFRCITSCEWYPDCISETLIKRIADKMVSDGYLDAGYEYIIIDDCWSNKTRDADDKLIPDPDRFPSGMKALADYVHDLGLKFGIYSDYGTETCGGFPGSQGYLKQDAETFAEWGVDYVKMDGCNGNIDTIEDDFAEMSGHLNATGRPILFSCEFPLYRGYEWANYSLAVEYCNTWRTGHDIEDRWVDVVDIATFYAANQELFRPYSGPGHWNDPDMLIIGNFGLSYEQAKAQMTVWSIIAAPLIMSVDLATIKPEFKDILLNKLAIRINQDPLGIPGEMISNEEDVMLWRKPLIGEDGTKEWALGMVSNRTDGFVLLYGLQFHDYINGTSSMYTITDVFEANSTLTGDFHDYDDLLVRIPPSGGILLHIAPKKYSDEP